MGIFSNMSLLKLMYCNADGRNIDELGEERKFVFLEHDLYLLFGIVPKVGKKSALEIHRQSPIFSILLLKTF